MLKSPLLFAISVLGMLFSSVGTASAKDNSLGLSFDLPPTKQAASSAIASPSSIDIAQKGTQQLIQQPTRQRTEQQPEQQLEQQPEQPPEQPLEFETTPINQISRPVETLRAISEEPETIRTTDKTNDDEEVPASDSQNDIGVQFSKSTLEMPVVVAQPPLDQSLLKQQTLKQPDPPLEEHSADSLLALTYETLELNDWMFEGGSGSLVAHTVGSAEGTRYRNGKKTRAYYGHTDPGNGVWNLGTFSYQHEATSPEDADRKQLKRLKRQGDQLQQQAQLHGLQLSLKEKLNGLDLANQAPLAALGEGGYIERLAQAYRLQMRDDEAIAWARTRAYIDPNTKTWNAPGLGNNLRSISQDQERRMAAIEEAMSAYEHSHYPEIALASLDTFQLEKSGLTGSLANGLTNSRLGASAVDNTPFGSGADRFASTDIDSTIADVSREASILSAALNFALPEHGVAEANPPTEPAAPIAETPAVVADSEPPLETIVSAPEAEAAVVDAIAAPSEAPTLSTLPTADIAPDEAASEIEAFSLEAFADTQATEPETAPEETPTQTEEARPTLASLLNGIPERETGEEVVPKTAPSIGEVASSEAGSSETSMNTPELGDEPTEDKRSTAKQPSKRPLIQIEDKVTN